MKRDYRYYKSEIVKRNLIILFLSVFILLQYVIIINNNKIIDEYENMVDEIKNIIIENYVENNALLLKLETQKEYLLNAYSSELIRTFAYEDHIEVLSTIPAVVTSYAPLDPNAVEGMCYSGNPAITATGTRTRIGVAASDWNELPVGTIIEIPGYGEAIVEDTGSAMRNYKEGIKIDIFHATRTESFIWGEQPLDIIIKGRI